MQVIVNVLHKKDPLSVVRTVFQDFVSVVATKRGKKESFSVFVSRFAASASKFNSHENSCELPEALM